MRRATVLTLASVVAVGGALSPLTPLAGAAPKKPAPITKTYTATAPLPDPSNYAGAATGEGYSVCAQNVPQSFHTEVFQVPAAGSLKVEVKDYQGDWDLLLLDADREELATGGSSDLGVPEIAVVKFKRKTTMSIVACNWAGSPTATVTYTFTYK